MPRDWKGPYRKRLAKQASERGKRMANARWDRERERLARLDTLDPVRVGGRVVERLIRVIDERWVVERSFYEFDRPCDWQRKRKELFRL